MSGTLEDRRLRYALLAASAAVAVVVVVLLLSRGGDGPPASRSAQLVPPNALVFVHLSTDRNRDAVKRTLDLAERFPGWPALRDSLLSRIGAGGGPEARRALARFAGDEAALALLDTGGERADSLILLEVTDRDRARSFIERRTGPPIGVTSYKGTPIRNYGSTQAAFAGDFLAIGQFESVRAAVDLAAGRGRSLADDPRYRAVAGDLPKGRVADGWASAAGIRRLLAPAGGVLGAAGALLDRPGLRAAGLALAPADGGARITVRSLEGPGAPRPAPFKPDLQDVPADVSSLIETAGPGRAGVLAAGLTRFKGDLRRRTGVSFDTEILPHLRGQAAFTVGGGSRAPTLTVVAPVRDERATRAALARLQGPGRRPSFAVSDGKLFLSTSAQGIDAARGAKRSLAGTNAFKTVLGERPARVTSLVFLDSSQLLRLFGQAGFLADPAFVRTQSDLRKVRAAGAVSSVQGNISTTELFLQIP